LLLQLQLLSTTRIIAMINIVLFITIKKPWLMKPGFVKLRV
jgi:hypothetical protein